MGAISGRRSVVARVDDGLMRFLSVTPGLRRGSQRRIAICAVAYALLFLPVFFVLFVALPAVAFLFLFWFAILTGGWNAREAIAPRLPSPWRPAPGSPLRAWLGVLALLAVAGLPAALLANFAYAFTPLAALAWWIVWREKGSVASRVLHALVAVVFMPLALGIWYMRRGGAWSKVAVFIGILLSLETYGFLLVLWLTDNTVFGNGTLAAVLLLSVSIVFLGGAFLISVAIRIADGFCEAQPARPVSSRGQPNAPRFSIVSAGLLLPLRLALWALIQGAFVAPWIYEVQGEPQLGDSRFLIYFLVATAALPMAVTSLVAVILGSRGRQQTADRAMEQHLGVALASSLLLALGVSVTFAAMTWSVFSDPNVALPFFAIAWALIGLAAAVAGLNIGLSLRLVKRGAFRRYWTYLSSALTAVILALADVVLLASIASAAPMQSPNDVGEFATDFAVAALFPALAVAGLSGGLLVSALLYPALQSFARTMTGLREMLKPIVGFVCGYALIVLTFGAAYYAIYLAKAASFACTQVDGSSASCTPQLLGERDFMFLSVNTALPLGFSPIKPVENHVQWLSAAELWAATAWVVVVFAAMLHTIQTQMVKKITAEQVTQMRLRIATRKRPTETSLTSYDWPD